MATIESRLLWEQARTNEAVRRSQAALSIVGAVGVPASVKAQDASFGCKVLLCAAASAPGWSGIPYCVPVMQQLFRELARGRPWPSCPEGHASSLGYDPYQPCPPGMTAMQNGESDSAGLVAAPGGNVCAEMSEAKTVCMGSDGGFCQTTYPLVPRETRAEPHYVDIATANGTQRFYFSLRGY